MKLQRKGDRPDSGARAAAVSQVSIMETHTLTVLRATTQLACIQAWTSQHPG